MLCCFFWWTRERTRSRDGGQTISDHDIRANRVRIPRPKIEQLAFQAQGVGIFTEGETPVDNISSQYIASFTVLYLVDPRTLGVNFCGSSKPLPYRT